MDKPANIPDEKWNEYCAISRGVPIGRTVKARMEVHAAIHCSADEFLDSLGK